MEIFRENSQGNTDTVVGMRLKPRGHTSTDNVADILDFDKNI